MGFRHMGQGKCCGAKGLCAGCDSTPRWCTVGEVPGRCHEVATELLEVFASGRGRGADQEAHDICGPWVAVAHILHKEIEILKETPSSSGPCNLGLRFSLAFVR